MLVLLEARGTCEAPTNVSLPSVKGHAHTRTRSYHVQTKALWLSRFLPVQPPPCSLPLGPPIPKAGQGVWSGASCLAPSSPLFFYRGSTGIEGRTSLHGARAQPSATICQFSPPPPVTITTNTLSFPQPPTTPNTLANTSGAGPLHAQPAQSLSFWMGTPVLLPAKDCPRVPGPSWPEFPNCYLWQKTCWLFFFFFF